MLTNHTPFSELDKYGEFDVSKTVDGVKVLGDGELEKKLTIKANKFSKTAIEKLEKSGSTIEVI